MNDPSDKSSYTRYLYLAIVIIFLCAVCVYPSKVESASFTQSSYAKPYSSSRVTYGWPKPFALYAIEIERELSTKKRYKISRFELPSCVHSLKQLNLLPFCVNVIALSSGYIFVALSFGFIRTRRITLRKFLLAVTVLAILIAVLAETTNVGIYI